MSRAIMVASFRAGTEMRMSAEWEQRPDDWECPCCLRIKDEIMRLDKNGFVMCQLHRHHDHIEDYDFDLVDVEAMFPGGLKFLRGAREWVSRFDSIVICSDCNTADGRAKRMLRLPTYFSFSVPEIAQFILRDANEDHDIDKDAALNLWNEQKNDYKRRIKFLANAKKAVLVGKNWGAGYTGVPPRIVPRIKPGSMCYDVNEDSSAHERQIEKAVVVESEYDANRDIPWEPMPA